MITEEQFGAYHTAYNARLERFLASKFRLTAEAAQDAAADAWLKAWTAREQYEGRSSFYTWLSAVAFNAYLASARHWKREKYDISLGELTTEPSVEPVDVVDYHSVFRFLLTLRDGALVVMRHRDGLSIEELCAVTGLPDGSVKCRINRAKTQVVAKFRVLRYPRNGGNMAQKEQPIGNSSSPIVNRVIQNSHNQQQPVSPSNATKPGTQYNKQPVRP
ncbi:MAG: RNA polymerase sigma factor [Patescibacteria group bacterium]|nr:RNA polymerase sigma factor [Patescibacteria group bacterium]